MQGGMNMDKTFHIDKNYIQTPLTYGDFSLYQIGRLYCSENAEIGDHPHFNWFELTVICDGEGFVYANQKGVAVRKGDIFLSFPCDIHRIVSSAHAPLHYDFCSFNTESEELKAELEKITTRFSSAQDRVFRNETIRYLVSDAIVEMNEEQKYRDQIMANMLHSILIYLIRAFLSGKERKSPRNVSQNDMLCYRIMNYIDTHIYTMENLEDLGDLMNYNYSYLSGLFRRTTSESLRDYYRKRKLCIAQSLLAENKLTVTEIATLLNYSSVYAFSRSFKKYFGSSPKCACRTGS